MAIVRYSLQTGSIWQKHARVRSQIIRRVCEKLLKEYGKPRLGNPENPIDNIVFIIISNRTTPEIAIPTYNRIKFMYPTWNLISKLDQPKLQLLLKPAGLSNIKSQQISKTLIKIKNDFGKCSLSGIKNKSDSDIENYLVSLPGVSKKVAKCVMMFTLGAKVLPVDTHVHRIAKRLGWSRRKRADQCHDELEALIAPKYRYSFHVDCIMHGRHVCLPTNPACDECTIKKYCEY
jgi:endonuclease III